MNIAFDDSDGLFSPRVWNGTIEYSASTAAVPEPSSLAILGIGAGIVGLVSIRRRRREQKQVAAG